LESVEFIGSDLTAPQVTKKKSKVILIKIYLFLKNSPLISATLNLLHSSRWNKLLNKSYLPFSSQVVTGYFADFSFYDSLSINGSNLSVFHQSTEYLSLKNLFEKRKFIAIHVRYGDFLNSEIKDNVLDSAYYMKSLKIIEDMFEEQLEIIIFCDQPELIDDIFLLNKRFSIFDSYNLSAFEVMKIMGCASAMVLCLSTFGFWSAKLSMNNPIVVYPSCNSLGQTFIKGIPTSWIPVDPPWKI
jgi:hypothetical protein